MMEQIPFGLISTVAKVFLRFKPNQIPICKTEIRRGGRGFYGERLVAIHPREDGIEIKHLEPDGEG